MGDRNSHFWLNTDDAGKIASRFKSDAKPFVSSAETRKLTAFGKIKDQQTTMLKSSLKKSKGAVLKSRPKSFKHFSHMLQLKLRVLRLRHGSSKRFKFAVAGLGAILVLTIAGVGGLQLFNQDKKGASVAAQVTGVYGYKPVLPKGQTAESLDNSALAATYDAPSKILSYKDKFAGSGFTVSQQPVSDNFASKDEAIASAVDGFGAGLKMETNKGTAYIATDRVTGYQVALVPVNKKVLLYIRSENIVDEYTWKVYIDSLQMQS